MSIEEKRREVFEAWATNNGLATTKAREALMFANARRVPAGGYVLQETVAAWAAFNAALDAVEIVLPFEACNGMMNGDRVRAAIESTSLGLKVKS